MKIINVSTEKPPVTVQFTAEEALVLWEIAGYDKTIPDAIAQSSLRGEHMGPILRALRALLGQVVK